MKKSVKGHKNVSSFWTNWPNSITQQNFHDNGPVDARHRDEIQRLGQRVEDVDAEEYDKGDDKGFVSLKCNIN